MTSAKKRVRIIDITRLDLPRRLPLLRWVKGLSVKGLADKAGISDRTVEAIEAGERERVLENTLLCIALALDISREEMLQEQVPKADEPTTPAPREVATDEPATPALPEVETDEQTTLALLEVETNDPSTPPPPEVELDEPATPALPEVETDEQTTLALLEVEANDPSTPPPPEVELDEPTTPALPEVDTGESTTPLLRTGPAEVTSARLRHPRRRVAAIAALLFLMLVMAVVVLRLMFGQVRAERGNGGLVGRNARGEIVWRFSAKATIEFLDESPWHDGTILVGLRGDASDGGRVLLLTERSGHQIWEVSPDQERIRAAYGPDLLYTGGGFTAFRNKAVDIDGDRTPELALVFIHGRFCPASLVLIERDGRHLGQYDTKGHIYSLLGEDVDGDGREELLAAGTNNEACYQGGTVILLDEVCFRGAAQDSLAGGNPAIPDSARVRLVMPQLGEPYMTLLQRLRLDASDLMVFREPDGAVRIAVSVGVDGMGVIVTMDAGLHPLRVQASDRVISLAETWPDSVTALRGFPRQEWLQNKWLPRAVRFEAGHWGARKGTPGG
jgi:transcriptional regulator with XRE-family HTH domain